MPVSCPHDLSISVEPRFLDAAASMRWLRWCRAHLVWEQEQVRLFGRTHSCRRLTAFVGEPGLCYRYSGVEHRGAGIPRPLSVLLGAVARHLGCEFNCILATWYRDGDDRLGWHADAETALGPDPILAVLSLGAPRTLAFRTRAVPRCNHRVELPAGSLLRMGAGTQLRWQHSVPPRRGRTERISLGFRQLVAV